MAEPRPTVARFVKAAARVELARGAGAHEPAVAGRMLVRLHQELAKVMGPAAFDVILARALVLARRAHPVLTGVTAGPYGAIAGLDDATGDGVARQEDLGRWHPRLRGSRSFAPRAQPRPRA